MIYNYVFRECNACSWQVSLAATATRKLAAPNLIFMCKHALCYFDRIFFNVLFYLKKKHKKTV